MRDTPRPLDTCYFPVRVQSASGVSFYPCGRCSACKKRKQSLWASRLRAHSDTGKYTILFITLTYHNDHLPLVEVDPVDGSIVDITRTRFSNSGDGSFDRLSCLDLYDPISIHSEPIFNSESSIVASSIPHFVDHYDRFNKKPVFDQSPRFGVCLKKDVQDFVKRLRSTLARDSSLCSEDLRFSYFICSEYGPKTFRPHYHGLLFFHSQKVASLCNEKLIYEVWGKSLYPCDHPKNKTSQIVHTTHAAASYVSKYVTSLSRLPSHLDNSLFNVFHLQSKAIAIGSEVLDIDHIPDLIDKSDILCHRTYFDQNTGRQITTSLPYPRSTWNRAFPPFLLSRTVTIPRLYKIFEILSVYARNGSDIPDYRPILELDFGLNSFVSRSKFFTRFFISEDPVFRSLDYKLLGYQLDVPIDSFHSVHDGITAQGYNITPSWIIDRVWSDPRAYDLFLFGFEQNRCACRKIIKAMRNYNWCSDPMLYAFYYMRFYGLEFANKLRSQYDYENILFSDNSFAYTALDVAELYPSLLEKLPDTFDGAMTPELDNFDSIVTTQFGLSIYDFYDDVGNLLTFDLSARKYIIAYRDSIRLYYKAARKKRSYAHYSELST